jgi:hypothetical protein
MSEASEIRAGVPGMRAWLKVMIRDSVVKEHASLPTVRASRLSRMFDWVPTRLPDEPGRNPGTIGIDGDLLR